MAASPLFIVGQFFDDIDNTKISKDGCRWLSKADWKSLDYMNLSCYCNNLGFNNIFWEGCRFLSYCGDWEIRVLNMGTLFIIEIKTKSGIWEDSF
jgi:hypothetical protein